MITFRGAALVATAIFTFLLARLTEVGWLYLLDATLWGIILLSLALPSLFLMSLDANVRLNRSGRDSSPAEGQLVEVELALVNSGRWPRYLVSAGYYCPVAPPGERWPRFFVHHLAGRDSAVLLKSFRCYRRGLQEFRPDVLESKAPFGLFLRRRRVAPALAVLVYPQVFPLEKIPMLEGMEGTRTRPQRTRAGQEIAGSRSYFPGDPLRHIHWRNTAREGRLMVKEYEDSQENILAIAFDSSVDEGDGRDTILEYSIKMAASVAGYITRRGGGVRLLTGRLPDQEMQWPALLRQLALLEVEYSPGLPHLIESLSAGSRVLALVSESDPIGVESLERRAAHLSGLAVVVMEGFGDSPLQQSEVVVESLRRAGDAVSCHRGHLAEELRSLETGVPLLTAPLPRSKQ